MSAATDCLLCEGPGGVLVFQGDKFRVVRADEPAFPGFYRVVWQEHVAEFSDLAEADRVLCMAAVVEVELAVRRHLAPHKVNLAALGNAVTHLHWHVIARFRWDSHFPASVWSAAQRASPVSQVDAVMRLLPALEADLAARLAERPGTCTAL